MEQLDELGLESLVKLVLAVCSLLVFLVLVSLLPGIDRLVPTLPIPITDLVGAAVTLVAVVLLVRLTATARAVIQDLPAGSAAAVSRAAAVVYWAVILVAVAVVYEGFGVAVEPIWTETGSLRVYDLAFFLLGVPLLVVGYSLYRLLDPLAEVVVSSIHAGTTTETAPDRSISSGSAPESGPAGDRRDDPDRR